VPVEPVTPDQAEAGLDVGAPAPVEPAAVQLAAVPPAAVEPVTLEDVRDDVEEIVVEQGLAAERHRHSAVNGRVDDAAVPAAEQAGGTNGVVVPAPASDEPEPVGRRRRGRVTRTGGAPTATAGDAPAVTVVTVPAVPTVPTVRPAAEEEPPAQTPTTVQPPAPDAPAPRTRRRRAASRPAGPPAAEASGPETSGTETSGTEASAADPV